jgi:hypothetical protein
MAEVNAVGRFDICRSSTYAKGGSTTFWRHRCFGRQYPYHQILLRGFRRKSKLEYMHYLTISLGSAAELETQLLIVQRQYNKIDVVNALSLANEVQRMLNSMTSSYKY